MKKFYDKWWKDGAIGVSDDFKWKWPRIKSALPPNNATILDFGCGDGRYIKEVLSMHPYKIIGVDISEFALKKSRKRFPGARFYHLSGDDKLPVNTSSVDFVIAGDVIEHIFDVPNFLKEMNRILKKNGKIFISTPYHGMIKNIVLSIIGFDIVFDPTSPHIRFFTRKSLSRLLSKHGFVILEYGQYGRFPPVSKGMYMLAQKKITIS